MPFKLVKSLRLSFNPLLKSTISRQIIDRCSKTLLSSNPNLQLEHELHRKRVPPLLEATYLNGKVLALNPELCDGVEEVVDRVSVPASFYRFHERLDNPDAPSDWIHPYDCDLVADSFRTEVQHGDVWFASKRAFKKNL